MHKAGKSFGIQKTNSRCRAYSRRIEVTQIIATLLNFLFYNCFYAAISESLTAETVQASTGTRSSPSKTNSQAPEPLANSIAFWENTTAVPSLRTTEQNQDCKKRSSTKHKLLNYVNTYSCRLDKSWKADSDILSSAWPVKFSLGTVWPSVCENKWTTVTSC